MSNVKCMWCEYVDVGVLIDFITLPLKLNRFLRHLGGVHACVRIELLSICLPGFQMMEYSVDQCCRRPFALSYSDNEYRYALCVCC